MRIERIEIIDFKNIAGADLEFSPGVNCIVGDNGMGKSNLLEAIYFLSFVRPMQPLPESELIRHGSQMLLVKGMYDLDAGAKATISCGITRGKGKSLKLNGKEYDRMSAHIGRFPLVSILPADTRLVTDGADERRKLMDMVISQADGAYLSNLIAYGRALESRNRLLRSGITDPLLYESVEAGMEATASAIHDARAAWIKEITPAFRSYYSAISADAEEAGIAYRSQLDGAGMASLLDARRGKDAALGFTSAGPHRDDIATSIGTRSMRRLGSQGQIKTYAIALRLAIYDYLRRRSGVRPILLLDDIFDKLDASRVASIMRLVSGGEGFGQIFITDTNRAHLDEILAAIDGDKRLFMARNGVFTAIGSGEV